MNDSEMRSFKDQPREPDMRSQANSMFTAGGKKQTVEQTMQKKEALSIGDIDHIDGNAKAINFTFD